MILILKLLGFLAIGLAWVAAIFAMAYCHWRNGESGEEE